MLLLGWDFNFIAFLGYCFYNKYVYAWAFQFILGNGACDWVIYSEKWGPHIIYLYNLDIARRPCPFRIPILIEMHFRLSRTLNSFTIQQKP